MKYEITRLEDGKEFKVESYKFVVFNERGQGKELIENPDIGTSLILPPYNSFYSWMTSKITEVIDNYNFKTQNSTYEIKNALKEQIINKDNL